MRATSIPLVVSLLLCIFTFNSSSATKVPEVSLRESWYNNIVARSCGASASCSKKGGLCMTFDQPCPGKVTNDCIGDYCICCIIKCDCDEKCKKSRSCKQRGGDCITANQACYGHLKPKLCKGKDCTCCIPETTTSPAPTIISQYPPELTTSTTLPPPPTTTPEPTTTPAAPTTTTPEPTTTPAPDCNYNGVGYDNGDIINIGCAQLRCENNVLVPTFEVNAGCEECQVYNDPHFRTFDNEAYNWHQRCNFSLVQNTKNDNPDYAVYGDFRDCTSKKYKKEMPACVRHTVIMDNQHNTFRFNHLDLTYIIVNGVKQDLSSDSSISQFDNTLVWKNAEDQTRILMGDTLYVGIIRGQINIWAQPSLTDSLYGMCRFSGGLSKGHYGSIQRKGNDDETKDMENFALSWRTLIQENEICLQRKSPAAAEPDLCVGKKKSTLKKFSEKCTASIEKAAPHLHEDTKNIKIESCVQDLCACKNTAGCLEDVSDMAENDQFIQDHVFVECGSKFTDINGECLYISTLKETVPWRVAKYECNKMKAELVAPVSNDFMRQQKENFGTFWVGGRYYRKDSSYTWNSGEIINSGWEKGSPTKLNDGFCVAYKYYGSTDRGLTDMTCDDFNRYICKQDPKR